MVTEVFLFDRVAKKYLGTAQFTRSTPCAAKR
jgi:hypothetical protein